MAELTYHTTIFHRLIDHTRCSVTVCSLRDNEKEPHLNLEEISQNLLSLKEIGDMIEVLNSPIRLTELPGFESEPIAVEIDVEDVLYTRSSASREKEKLVIAITAAAGISSAEAAHALDNFERIVEAPPILSRASNKQKFNPYPKGKTFNKTHHIKPGKRV